MGIEAAYARLTEIDPETARQVHPRDMVRISRALEVFEQTGVPISVHHQRANVFAAADVMVAATLILDPPLDVLRDRIARRFDAMMAAGFLDETRRLRAQYGPDARALQALGYKQLGEHLDGLLTLDEAVAAAKAATVAYARRQRTWFRKESDAWRVETTPDPDTVVRWWKRNRAGLNPRRAIRPPPEPENGFRGRGLLQSGAFRRKVPWLKPRNE